MKGWSVAGTGILLACIACTGELEAKVETLATDVSDGQHDRKEIEKTLERQSKDLAALQRKFDELSAKLDALTVAKATPPRPTRSTPDPAATYALPIEGDPFDGPSDALVTIVKGYDYACPYCERVRVTLDQIRQQYGRKVRIVYKHFVVHPSNAMAGALGFCAAAKQGKHKQMDRLLWENGFKQRQLDVSDAPPDRWQGTTPQKCWETRDGCPRVVEYAKEIGLSVSRFKSDMRGPCFAHVQDDMQQLRQFAASSTPTFFINGRYLSGAQPLETFVALIDEELGKAKERVKRGTSKSKYYREWVLESGRKTVDVAPP